MEAATCRAHRPAAPRPAAGGPRRSPARAAGPGATQQQQRDVVGERPAVRRLDALDEPLEGLAPARRPAAPSCSVQRLQAAVAEPVGPSRAALDEAVGVEQQGPAPGEDDRVSARRPAPTPSGGAGAGRQPAAVRRRSASAAGGRPGAPQPPGGGRRPRRRRPWRRALGWRSCRALLEGVASTRRRAPAEDQRSPGDAQRDAQRRLVRPLAADVPDERVDHAVLVCTTSKKSPPEQRPRAARAASTWPRRPAASVEDRARQQPARQARVLGACSSATRAAGASPRPARRPIAYRTRGRAARPSTCPLTR